MKAFILTTLAVAMALLGLTAFTPPAPAATPTCGGYADLLQVLDRSYGEKLLFTGIVSPGQTAVVTTNPDGSSWTILVVAATGKACIAAAGKEWQPGTPAALGMEG